MKAKELKIGDLVSFKGTPVKVCHIDPPYIYAFDEEGVIAGSHENCNNFDPIPLTEEILEKNGWKEDDEIWGIDYTFGHLHIEFFSNGKEIEAMVSVTDDRDVCCLRQIKYIHELQHLLWAMEIDDDLKI